MIFCGIRWRFAVIFNVSLIYITLKDGIGWLTVDFRRLTVGIGMFLGGDFFFEWFSVFVRLWKKRSVR